MNRDQASNMHSRSRLRPANMGYNSPQARVQQLLSRSGLGALFRSRSTVYLQLHTCRHDHAVACCCIIRCISIHGCPLAHHGFQLALVPSHLTKPQREQEVDYLPTSHVVAIIVVSLRRLACSSSIHCTSRSLMWTALFSPLWFSCFSYALTA